MLLCLLVILLDIAKELIEVNDRRIKFFLEDLLCKFLSSYNNDKYIVEKLF